MCPHAVCVSWHCSRYRRACSLRACLNPWIGSNQTPSRTRKNDAALLKECRFLFPSKKRPTSNVWRLSCTRNHTVLVTPTQLINLRHEFGYGFYGVTNNYWQYGTQGHILSQFDAKPWMDPTRPHSSPTTKCEAHLVAEGSWL